jgi:hypothetical protein
VQNARDEGGLYRMGALCVAAALALSIRHQSHAKGINGDLLRALQLFADISYL